MSISETRTLSDKAWEFVQANHLKEAQAIFERVCALDETDAEAWMMRGSIHGEFSEFDSASSCLERAITLDPAYSDAYFNLGKIQIAQDKPYLAMDCCRKAVDLDPEFVEAWMLLLSIQDRLGYWSEAEDACQEAMAHLAGDTATLARLTQIADTLKAQQGILTHLGETKPIFVLGIPRSGTSMICLLYTSDAADE